MEKRKSLGTALVTGGAKRIGRAIALRLAQEGFNLAIHCNRSLTEAQETAREIIRLGSNAVVIQANLEDLRELRRIKDGVVAVFGGLDLLVNNASAYPSPALVQSGGGLLAESPEHFEQMFKVNARAPFFLLQEFATLLSASPDGRVVNILDRAWREPHISRAAYSMSRAAGALLSSIARETLKGVRVNDLELGWVLPGDEMTEEERSKRSWVGPEKVAEAVISLVLDRQANGQRVLLG